MYVITLTIEELEILQRLKPDIHDILAKVPYSGKEKRTYILPRDKAKTITLISRNKHTISVWNHFNRQLKEKLIHFHRNFYNCTGNKGRESWLTFVNRKHRAILTEDFLILDVS